MSKPVGLRRPRKEVPDDMVSCPPTLNLTKSSVKRAKQFVNELIEMSPRLSEIGESTKPDEDVSALGLASMLQSTVSSLDTAQFHPTGKKIKTGKERNVRQFKTSRRSPPRSYVEGDLPPPPPNTRAQHTTSTAQRSGRAPPKTTRKQHEEAGVPASRPRMYRNRRNPSVYSSVHSSMGSSMVSWDSMSQSVYSVYTTATVIARRPAWGHYVVGVMVFLGWIVHHYYFSEYFQPLYLQQTVSRSQQTLVKDLILDVSPNLGNEPSMLRGAMKESAVYLQQDYEKRDDYHAIKPVDLAFDTIGDTKAASNGSTPELEESAAAVGEEDAGGPPPPVASVAAEATTKDTDADNSLVVDENDKCKDGSTAANCTKI